MMDEISYAFHLAKDKLDAVVPLQFRTNVENIPSRKVTNDDKEVVGKKVVMFDNDNPIVNKVMKDIDVSQELIDNDDLFDIEITGKFIDRTSKILLDSNKQFVHKYDEFEVIKDKEGNVIKETQRIEKPLKNINVKENPIRVLKTEKIIDVIKKFAFKASYFIAHTDGLSYDFIKSLAEELHNNKEMALIAPLKKIEVNGKKKMVPQRIRLRNGSREYWGWLEGRIQGKGYSLILHLTSLELI